MTQRARGAVRWVMAAVLLTTSVIAGAEPYLAVAKGMHCSSCHSHPSGGGKRTVYGNVFAQAELAARRLGDADAAFWTGEVREWLSIGANVRADYAVSDAPNTAAEEDLDFRLASVYAEASLVPKRLSLYVDQRLAPDTVGNRELYLKLASADRRFHLTAGQFFLPYGLRLQDDGAFIREATGINFAIPDRGVQLGYESGPWSAALSITNGTGTGSVLDSADQGSFLAQYVQPAWRAGFSVNSNDNASGKRDMQGVFAGLKTGSIAWLAEIDLVSDEITGVLSQDAVAGFLEANWRYRKGHNLKVSYEYFDPDRDTSEDHEVRWSLVWEYAPLQFLQARLGARRFDGVPQFDSRNRRDFFIELHAFF